MSNNGPRFQARAGSHHNCCFDAEVVDTLAVGKWTAGFHPTFCECPDIETAIIIARALNRDAMS